jgi:hypothetical protein
MFGLHGGESDIWRSSRRPQFGPRCGCLSHVTFPAPQRPRAHHAESTARTHALASSVTRARCIVGDKFKLQAFANADTQERYMVSKLIKTIHTTSPSGPTAGSPSHPLQSQANVKPHQLLNPHPDGNSNPGQTYHAHTPSRPSPAAPPRTECSRPSCAPASASSSSAAPHHIRQSACRPSGKR